MKRGVLALCLGLLLLSGTQTANAQRKLNERHAAQPAGLVRIFLLAGQVNVIGWDRDSLVVTGISHETSQEKFAVARTEQGFRLGMWAQTTAKALPSSITVYVPAHSRVAVKSESALINVSNVAGSVDVFSVGGNVRVNGSPRALYAETMGGEIVTNVTSPSARVKTASGAIRGSGSVADWSAVSVSGDISTALTHFGRARLESVSGHIRFQGALPGASILDVVNQAGAITLMIPARTTADFAFNLYEAELQDEFGIKKRWMMNDDQARAMTFGLGYGTGARVTISSFKGLVSIRRLESAK